MSVRVSVRGTRVSVRVVGTRVSASECKGVSARDTKVRVRVSARGTKARVRVRVRVSARVSVRGM